MGVPVDDDPRRQREYPDDRRDRDASKDAPPANERDRLGKPREHDARGDHQPEAPIHLVHGQRREEVGHFQLRDDEAVDQAAQEPDSEGDRHRQVHVDAVVLDEQPHHEGREGRHRADGKIDSARGDDQGHGHPQNHEDRRIVQDDHHVRNPEEPRFRDRHDQAQRDDHHYGAENVDVAPERGQLHAATGFRRAPARIVRAHAAVPAVDAGCDKAPATSVEPTIMPSTSGPLDVAVSTCPTLRPPRITITRSATAKTCSRL